MTRFHLCAADQIKPNTVLRVDIPQRISLAVYNLDGTFYATENTCTHGEASLAEGMVDDGQIICPFHGGAFDIRSGEPTGTPCIVALKTYPVSCHGMQLYAELE